MQCQTQIYADPNKKDLLDMVAAINRSDVAWFRNIHTVGVKQEDMEAFDNIECQTIERCFNQYIKSGGDN